MLINREKSAFQPSQNASGTLSDPRIEIDVVDLLRWAYQTQRVDEVVRRSAPAGVGAGYRSNAARAFETGCLGVITDGGRMGWGADGADYLPEDAERVHDAVRSLRPGRMVGIVIEYAKQGVAPDWMEGVVPMPVAILRANGRPEMEYHDAAKTRPAYCCLRYEPVDPDHLAFVRRLYVEWWDAVSALVPMLRGLERYSVKPPAMLRNPWMGGA